MAITITKRPKKANHDHDFKDLAAFHNVESGANPDTLLYSESKSKRKSEKVTAESFEES